MTKSVLRIGLHSAAIALLVTGSALAASNAGEVVATVDGKNITAHQLNEKTLSSLTKSVHELHAAKEQALQQMVADILLEREAKAKSTSLEKLLAANVDAKVTPVTDAEAQEWYDKNPQQVRGRQFEQVKGQIASFIARDRQSQAYRNYVESLKKGKAIKMSLEPPRSEVTVAKTDPVKGPADAPITIVEWSDFQCPYCSKVGPALKQVQEAYGDKVRIVFRDFPLSFHQDAQKAAEAAQCAREQGKFWEYHDKLFENAKALKVDNLKQYAKALGLNTSEFDTCLTSGKHEATVKEDMADGIKAGVQGTPSFYINGRKLSGGPQFANFKKVIDDELQRLDTAVN